MIQSVQSQVLKRQSMMTDAHDTLTFELEMNGDSLREECGVFGVFGHDDAAALTALGMHALQHRGQEACGIVSFDGKRFHSERRIGLVGDAFSKPATMQRLKGRLAVGHNRYSTTGEQVLRNVQPMFAELSLPAVLPWRTMATSPMAWRCAAR